MARFYLVLATVVLASVLLVQGTDKVEHAYALSGSNAALPCNPSGSKTINSRWILPQHIPWSSRHQENQNGDLLISSSTLSDSGIYTCESGDATPYVHHLKIYELERQTFSFGLSYVAKTCNYAKYKIKHIKQIFCNGNIEHCDYLFLTKCSSSKKSLDVTILSNSTGIPDVSFGSGCDTKCIMDKISEKAEKTFQAFISKLKREDQNLLNDQANPLNTFFGLLFTKVQVVSSFCTPGYEKGGEFICYPCGPGKMNSNYNHVCIDCPIGEYSSLYASTACQRCPKKMSTSLVGAPDESQCVAKTNLEARPTLIENTQGTNQIEQPSNESEDEKEMTLTALVKKGKELIQSTEDAVKEKRQLTIALAAVITVVLIVAIIIIACTVIKKCSKGKATEKNNSQTPIYQAIENMPHYGGQMDDAIYDTTDGNNIKLNNQSEHIYATILDNSYEDMQPPSYQAPPPPRPIMDTGEYVNMRRVSAAGARKPYIPKPPPPPPLPRR